MIAYHCCTCYFSLFINDTYFSLPKNPEEAEGLDWEVFKQLSSERQNNQTMVYDIIFFFLDIELVLVTYTVHLF